MKRVCLLIPFVLLLTACSPSPEDVFMQDYLKRISRVTGQSFSDFYPDPKTTVPALSDRQYVIASTLMKAITALDLLQCPKLSQKVAYRNSSLGKQMPPSQRLHYEKELLIELADCIEYLESSKTEDDILPILKTIYSSKQQQLPMVRWNVLFGGQTELVNQLHLTRYPLPGKQSDEKSGKQGTLTTLNFLTQYFPAQTTKTPYTRPELEKHLQQINASDYSGQLIRSALQLTHTFNETANMLEQRTNLSPICPNGKLTPTGERLYNVFQLLYAGKIQPYLANINQQGIVWQMTFSEFLKQLPAAPTSTMKSYLQHITSSREQPGIWRELQQSVLRHVDSWQAVFQQCRLQP